MMLRPEWFNRAEASAPRTATDHALDRLIVEIQDGLRHGFFELVVTCEITNHEQRRLTIRAGKSYQFTIPKGECE
jgi:hypothetical protein